ncbi:MAG: T9SS type A sorting domain-containing protein, partial [FCB group bacterium]|nr:T9SS type A sorting domain-containing protein [FCB group bacterium]
VGPIIGPVALTVPGGAFLERDRTQAIPATAPSGIYYYEAYAGDYPDEYYSIDSFTFEKMGDDDGGFAGSLSDWPCYGESFTDEDIHAAALPLSYLILSAYPNPLNPETNLAFNLPEAADVSLVIYDVQGREISALVQGWQNAGQHHLKWDASGLASGIYFAKLQAGPDNAMQKLLLLK